MTKNGKTLTSLELSLQKEKDKLEKLKEINKSLYKQRLTLKNKAKIVSLSEYKQIVKEINENVELGMATYLKVVELTNEYEKTKKNQKP